MGKEGWMLTAFYVVYRCTDKVKIYSAVGLVQTTFTSSQQKFAAEQPLLEQPVGDFHQSTNHTSQKIMPPTPLSSNYTSWAWRRSEPEPSASMVSWHMICQPRPSKLSHLLKKPANKHLGGRSLAPSSILVVGPHNSGPPPQIIQY